MNNKTFFATILCMATAYMPSFAETSITVNSVRQRWPWNNKVDVTYTIAGDDATANRVCKVMLTTVINGNAYAVYNPGLNVNVKPGTYTITWDDAPAGVICDTCTIKAEFYTSTTVPTGNDYMIVDLSDGAISYEGVFPASASLCGISGQNLSNARYNVDKYKKSHLVLRKVPAGTYLTGDGGTKEWTTDRDFYIGVFQWTSYQYWYLFEGNAAATEAHGATQVALVARALKFDGDIRGSSDSTITPAGTTAANFKKVVPWLNGKTGLSFDLPTEVMHEIATRAGTTTTYFWGTDANLASEYAVYGKTGKRPGTGWEIVGTKKPNAWGLYDMVGLDWQWCLDVRNGAYDDPDNADAFTIKTGSDASRIVRGGDAKSNTSQVGSARISNAPVTPNNTAAGYTFRIAYIVPKSGE